MERDPAETKEQLRRLFIGVWRKVSNTTCSRIYPDRLEFDARGTYAGRKSGELEFSFWDSGGFELLTETQVKISTANDAEIVYEYSLSKTELVFTDQHGCVIHYRRAM